MFLLAYTAMREKYEQFNAKFLIFFFFHLVCFDPANRKNIKYFLLTFILCEGFLCY